MGLLLKEMYYKGSREDILAEGKGTFIKLTHTFSYIAFPQQVSCFLAETPKLLKETNRRSLTLLAQPLSTALSLWKPKGSHPLVRKNKLIVPSPHLHRTVRRHIIALVISHCWKLQIQLRCLRFGQHNPSAVMGTMILWGNKLST